jgi:hypothetical protein
MVCGDHVRPTSSKHLNVHELVVKIQPHDMAYKLHHLDHFEVPVLLANGNILIDGVEYRQSLDEPRGIKDNPEAG